MTFLTCTLSLVRSRCHLPVHSLLVATSQMAMRPLLLMLKKEGMGCDVADLDVVGHSSCVGCHVADGSVVPASHMKKEEGKGRHIAHPD